MTKDEKLAKIYEVVADKTLSLGCRTRYNEGEQAIVSSVFTAYGEVSSAQEAEAKGYDFYIKHIGYSGDLKQSDLHGIIGHLVMIGDVLDFLRTKDAPDFTLRIGESEKDISARNTLNMLMWVWKSKRLPIDDQTQECIDFILGLL